MGEPPDNVPHDVARLHFVQKASFTALIASVGYRLMATPDKAAEISHVTELEKEVHIIHRLEGTVVGDDIGVRLWDQRHDFDLVGDRLSILLTRSPSFLCFDHLAG